MTWPTNAAHKTCQGSSCGFLDAQLQLHRSSESTKASAMWVESNPIISRSERERGKWKIFMEKKNETHFPKIGAFVTIWEPLQQRRIYKFLSCFSCIATARKENGSISAQKCYCAHDFVMEKLFIQGRIGGTFFVIDYPMRKITAYLRTRWNFI